MKKIKWIILAGLFLSASFNNSFAQCTIAVNSTTSSSAGIFATSLTISHTVSGSNTILIVRASTANGDPSSVTWNGTNLTKLATKNYSSQYTSIWYLVNPAAGTYNVVANGSSGFTPIVGVTSFTGVDQTTPFGTVVSGTFTGSNPSLSVSSATGELVLDVLNANFSPTVGSGQTQQYNIHEFVYYGAGSTEAGASSVTMSWSAFYPSGAQIAVPLKPCSSAPIADAGADHTICNGSGVAIGGSPTASSGTSPYTYAWTPSTGLSSTTTANPTASPTSTTTYTVTVTDSISATAADVVVVTVNTLPTVSAGSNQTICNGATVAIGGSPTASGGTSPYTYSWTPSTGLSSTTVANPNANPTSSTTYSITVTDNNGCSKATTVSVTVNPLPTVSAGSNKTTCSGVPVNIGGSPTASGGASPYTYSWSPTTALSSSTIANPDASPTSPTNYTVTVTDNSNCVQTAAVSVTVNPLPTVSAGANQTICNGATVAIGGSPTASGGTSPYTYEWTPSTGLSSTTIANPNANPTSSTTYSVIVTDNNGCSKATTVSITVNPLLSVDAGGSKVIVSGGSIAIGGSPSASGGTSPYTYSWNPSTGLNSTTIANPTASPTATTTYTLTVTDASGCSRTNSLIVTVNLTQAQCTLALGCTTTGYTSNPTLNSYTVSHTTVSGGNRLLVARVGSYNGDPTTITYNGANLTKYSSANDGGINYVSIWYLINPPVGTYNVVLNGAMGFTPEVGITCFTGADQTNPFGTAVSNTFSSNTSSSVNVSSASDQIVIDVIRTFSEFTASSGQTTQFHLNGFVSWASGSTKPGASSVTMSWSGFYSGGAQIGVSVKPAALLAANAGTNQSICSGSSIAIGGSPSASGGATPYTYAWSPSTGLSSSTVANPTANPTSTTTYSLTVTDDGGCTSDPSTMSVTVNPSPVVIVSSDTSICDGGSISLTATGAVSYTWSPTTAFSSTIDGINTVIVNPSTTTTYTVTGTGSNGCTNTASVVVTVNSRTDYSGTFTIGGTSPDFATITAAITELSSCKHLTDAVTYRIRGGTYNESIDLGTSVYYTKAADTIPVTFMPDDTVIVAVSAAENVVEVTNKKHVYIVGLKIETNTADKNAVVVSGCDNVLLFNCELNSSTTGNIAVVSSNSNFVEFNQSSIKNYKEGISLSGIGENNSILNSDITVQQNTLTAIGQQRISVTGDTLVSTDSVSAETISLVNSSLGVNITGNYIEGNGNTVFLKGNDAPAVIQQNTIVNGTGTAVFIKSFADQLSILGNKISSSAGNGIVIKDSTSVADSLDSIDGKYLFTAYNVVSAGQRGIKLHNLKKSEVLILNNLIDTCQVGFKITSMEADSFADMKIIGNLIIGSEGAMELDNNRLNSIFRSNTIVANGSSSGKAITINNCDNMLLHANNAVNKNGADVVIFDSYVPTNLQTSSNNWYSFTSSTVSNYPTYVFSGSDLSLDPKFVAYNNYKLSTKSYLLDTVITEYDSLIYYDLFNTPRAGKYDIGAVESESTALDKLQLDFVLDNQVAFSPNGDNSFDTFEIQGLSSYTTVDMKIYDRNDNIVFTSTSPTTYWDGIDMNTSALVDAGAFRYVLTLNNDKIIGGFVYVQR